MVWTRDGRLNLLFGVGMHPHTGIPKLTKYAPGTVTGNTSWFVQRYYLFDIIPLTIIAVLGLNDSDAQRRPSGTEPRTPRPAASRTAHPDTPSAADPLRPLGRAEFGRPRPLVPLSSLRHVTARECGLSSRLPATRPCPGD